MKKSNPFHFKQFSIEQDQCAMKVTLDACLFGAMIDVAEPKNLLDIGSGTGLLALMAAQRSQGHITTVEIENAAASQAKINIENSPFRDQITLYHGDIRTFEAPTQYDCIITNPPFFSDSLKGPDDARNLARHNDNLPFRDLCNVIDRLLSDDGSAWVLIPTKEYSFFKRALTPYQLFPNALCEVYSKASLPSHRVIVRIGRDIPESVEPFKIEVCDENGQYSPEFVDLLKDYYLNLS